MTVISQHCSPALEYFFINCKSVYIPLSVEVHEAQYVLADQILCVEQSYPDSLIIVCGDFNKENLSNSKYPNTNN